MKTKIVFLISMLVWMSAAYAASAQKIKALFTGLDGGMIAVSRLSSDSVLRVNQGGCVIISFRVSMYGNGPDPVEVDHDNNKLKQKVRSLFPRVKHGVKLYFEYIKALDAKGDTLTLEPLSFTIE